MEKKRIFYLDVIRVIAIISISLNHAVNRAYKTYDQSELFHNLPLWQTYLETIVYVFSRIGVPLFLMITGALILKKNIKTSEDVTKFYKHNLLSLFVTVEIWNFISFWLCSALDGPQSPIVLVKNCVLTLLFINQNVFDSYWYLPMILCIYLILPYMAMVKDRVSKKNVSVVMAVVFFISYLVPTINKVIASYSPKSIFVLPSAAVVVSGYALCVVLGYWLSTGLLDNIKSVWIFVVGLISFSLAIAIQYLLFSREEELTISYENVFVLMASVCLFELAKRYSNGLIKIQKPIMYISKIAFAIYVVHIIFVRAMFKFDTFFVDTLGRPLYLLALELVPMALSVLIITVTKRINFIKKYFYLIK